MSSTSVASAMALNAGVLLDYTRHWDCPHCVQQHVTNMPAIHTPLHQCAGMKGAWVPFVEHGTKASLRINRREDYLGSDTPTTDGEGVPVMSVTTLRDDGEDCHVFAPCINRNFTQQIQ
jgi:hypothetical protein